MPRINRIRVTNIKYDHDKKQLPDLTFNLDSKDAIMLLANGGGKTLLIQLILQVVLPNTRMGGRKMSELLRSNRYTGHIAVEWLLDKEGENDEYLCTGFCFTNGYNDRPIEYFNYIFAYEPDGDLTLDNLPLIKDSNLFDDQRPISYQEFKDWINENKSYRIETFDQIKTYQQRLKVYQIFPEEWKNIRDTNGSEGGVDKFFEKSKSTQQLMANLLIPSIEEVIYQNEKQKKELYHAFSEYRNMLLELPRIKKNLKDFEVIRDHAEQVVASVEELNDYKKERLEAVQNLAQLAKTFQNHKNLADEKIEEFEEKILANKKQERELNWKKDSHGVFLQQLKCKSALEEAEGVRNNYKKLMERLNKVKGEYNKIKGIYHYSRWQKGKQELERFQTRLEEMDKSEPELLDKLASSKGKLLTAWLTEKKSLEEKTIKIENTIKELEQEYRQLTDKIETADFERDEKKEVKFSLMTWFEDFKEKEEALRSLVSDSVIYTPVQSLEEYKEELVKLKRKRKNSEDRLEAIQSEENEIREQERQLYGQQQSIQVELKNLKDKWQKYKEEKDKVEGQLAHHERYITSIYEEKDDILIWVKNLLATAQERRGNLQAEIANLKEKWALLQNRDYYIPHNLLLKIKDKLDQNGIYGILGSEWLASQRLSKGEKELYLNNNPLIPYSIMIESNQLRGVRRVMSRIKDISADYPIFLILKDQLRLSADFNKKEIIELKEKLYLYQSDATNIFVSEMDFKDYKDRIKERLDTKEIRLERLKEKESQISLLKEMVTSFYRRFTQEEVTLLDENITRAENQLKKISKQIKELNEQSKELSLESDEIKEGLEKLKSLIINNKEIIAELEEFIKLYKQKDDKEAQKIKVERSISQLNRQIEGWKSEIEVSIEEKISQKENKKRVNQLLDEHQKDYRDYELDNFDQIDGIEESYSILKNRVNSLLEQLKQKQSSRSELEELVKKSRVQMEEAAEEIDELELDWEWLRENSRRVTRQEVREAKKRLENQEKSCTDHKEILNQAEKEVSSNQRVLDTLKGQIVNKYDREYYQDYSPEDHQNQYNYICQQIRLLEKKREEFEKGIMTNRTWKRDNENAYTVIKQTLEVDLRELWDNVEILSQLEWEELDGKPEEITKKYREQLKTVKNNILEQKRKVDRNFNKYLRKLEATNNPKINQFVRDVRTILEDKRLYDYDFVAEQFIRIFEAFDYYQAQLDQTLEESEKNMEHLTNLCYRRARLIYESISEIPKNSRVKIYGRSMQVIRLNWRSFEEDEAIERMYDYLNQVLEDLDKWKEEGRDEDQIDRRMKEMLGTKNLIEVIAPIEDCKITVYKPRKESIIRDYTPDYAPWDEVSHWSGGEEYSVYISMFMVMISHIREQLEGRQNIWKVLIADNPFGKASSPHILETVFQIAESNNIQLICFTAHRQDTILQRFPVVYSLQLRNAYGKEIMQAEQMESGFYQLTNI